MNLEIIKKLSENRDGGLKKLASDIGMSEQNLHRCIRNNKIQAEYLEQIAVKLEVDILQFFNDEVRLLSRNKVIQPDFVMTEDEKISRELVELCKSIVAILQQRDYVIEKLVSIVKGMQ